MYKKDSRLNYSGKKYYEIFIFAVLMFEFAVLLPNINNNDPYMVTFYFLSYQDLGLNTRLFIGSVFKIFAEYISVKTLFYCICIITACLNGLVALVLGKVLRRSFDETTDSLKIFIILFLSSPFSLCFLFYKGNFGYFDLYLVLVTVIMFLFTGNKYLKWLVPALCIIAEAIHPGWMLLYMPAIAIILIFEHYKNKYKKTSLILCAITFLIASISLFYFQFLPHHIDFKSPEAVVSFIQHRTDFPLNSDIIMSNYFLKVGTYFYDSLHAVKSFAISYSVCVLAMTSPLIAIFISLWLKAFKKAEDKFAKFIVLLCMASPAASFPMFFNLDWDRWIAAIFIVQFSLVIYFLDSGFACVVEAAEDIRAFFQKHLFLFVFIIVFMSMMVFSLGKVFLYLQIDKNYIFSLIAKYRALTG